MVKRGEQDPQRRPRLCETAVGRKKHGGTMLKCQRLSKESNTEGGKKNHGKQLAEKAAVSVEG